MPYLLSLVEEGDRECCPPEVRFGASMLRGTIHAFTALLTRNFLDLPMSAPAKEVLAAYAHDHLQVPSK